MSQQLASQIEGQRHEDTAAEGCIVRAGDRAFLALDGILGLDLILLDEDVAVAVHTGNLLSDGTADSCKENSQNVCDRSIAEELTRQTGHILTGQGGVEAGKGSHSACRTAGHTGSADIEECFLDAETGNQTADHAEQQGKDLTADDGRQISCCGVQQYLTVHHQHRADQQQGNVGILKAGFHQNLAAVLQVFGNQTKVVHQRSAKQRKQAGAAKIIVDDGNRIAKPEEQTADAHQERDRGDKGSGHVGARIIGIHLCGGQNAQIGTQHDNCKERYKVFKVQTAYVELDAVFHRDFSFTFYTFSCCCQSGQPARWTYTCHRQRQRGKPAEPEPLRPEPRRRCGRRQLQ